MYLKMAGLKTDLPGNFYYSKKDIIIKVWIRAAAVAVVNTEGNQMSYLRDKPDETRDEWGASEINKGN